MYRRAIEGIPGKKASKILLYRDQLLKAFWEWAIIWCS